MVQRLLDSSRAGLLTKAQSIAGELGGFLRSYQGRSSSLKLGAPPEKSGLRRHVGSSEAWPLAKARSTAGEVGYLIAQGRSSSLKLGAPPEHSAT